VDARASNWGNDLRDFVDRLERNNDLKTFSNADWNLEIGALTEIGAEQNGPALMFDKIKGYPPRFRVLTNFLQAQERTAIALGLPPELRGVKLLNAWREKLRDFKAIPPRTVSTGPVLENVMEGDAVDLGAFPTPLWHAHDGGRYIGTGTDPILLGAPPLKPPNNFVPMPLGAGILWDQLERAGIPEVKGVWGYVYSAQPGPFTVISIKQAYAGHAKQTLLVAAGARAGAYGGKFYVVVDDDVDITNLGDVIWAMSTRCSIRDDLDTVKNVWTSPSDPAHPPSEKTVKGYTSDRVLIDACRPYVWMDEFPMVNSFPPDVKEQYRKKWNF
jgi:3-polyprenyl-4-hydroxybenzoate decarboxylase